MRSDGQDLLQREHADRRHRKLSAASLAVDFSLPAEPAQEVLLKVEGVRVNVHGVVESERGIDHAQDPADDQAWHRQVVVARHDEQLHEPDELHRVGDRFPQLLGSFGAAVVFQSCKGCVIQRRQSQPQAPRDPADSRSNGRQNGRAAASVVEPQVVFEKNL